MKRLYVGLILFLLMEGVIALFLGYVYSSKKEAVVEERLLIRDAEYHAMERAYSSEAATIYESIVNTPAVLSLISRAVAKPETKRGALRKQLLSLLQPDYERLVKLGLKQLHFHTADNHSLLRMHRPDKFGDDLSDIRYSIAYTNRTKKPIAGFEEGRIYNGFRHLFPLFDPKDGHHIGSVEISFDSRIFLQKMREQYKGNYCFIVKKSIIDKKLWKDFRSNYQESILTPLYLREKKCLVKTDPGLKTLMHSIAGKYDRFFTNEKHFSTYISDDRAGYILTAIAIKNVKGSEAAAYIIGIEKTELINSLRNGILLIGFFLTVMNLFLSGLVAMYIRQFFLLREINQLLEERVKEKTMELRDANRNLEEKVNQQTKQIISQSRFAAMGEMAGMIAHHWRQPLNVLAAKTAYIRMLDEDGTLESGGLRHELGEIDTILQEISKTIDTFNHYVKPGNSAITKRPKEIIDEILTLMEPVFAENHISLASKCQCEKRISIYDNDMSQLLTAVLGNSIETFIRRDIKAPAISIEGREEAGRFHLEICDNAGGAEEAELEKIFEPYYSTKEERNYKGLGLYTAKETVEKHMKGTIRAVNKEEGLCIVIDIPLTT